LRLLLVTTCHIFSRIMKKFILAAFSLMVSVTSLAQGFFQGFEIVPFFYKDYVQFYSNSEWKQLFEAPGKPRSDNFDSLSFFAGGTWRPANYGVQLRGYRVLHKFKTKQHTWNLEWHAGPGYRDFKSPPSLFSGAGRNAIDTTKISLNEYEKLQLEGHYLDVYSSILIRNGGGSIHMVIGFGLQASLPVGRAKIEEDYNTTSYQWNTAIHTWEAIDKAYAHYSSNAIKTYIFSLTVPLGFSVEIGDNCELKFVGEYFNARRSPRVGDKYSEGVMFQLGFRYTFP
jgi:hypothetical protein